MMTHQPSISAIDIYDRNGASWVEMRSQHLIEAPWLDRFCALIPDGASVLDIGCGSGMPIASALIRRGFNVTGLDGSATMVALFRRNLPGFPVRFIDMRTFALGRRFAGLIAWDSLFHLPPDDQRDVFRRFRDHAEPDAALMFTSGDAEGESIGELSGDPLYHASLDRDEYRTLLEAAGFTVVAHVERDPACGNHTIWLAQHNADRRA